MEQDNSFPSQQSQQTTVSQSVAEKEPPLGTVPSTNLIGANPTVRSTNPPEINPNSPAPGSLGPTDLPPQPSQSPFSPPTPVYPPVMPAPILAKRSGSGKISPKLFWLFAAILLLAGLGLLGKDFILNYLKKKELPAKIEITYWGLFEDPSALSQVIEEYEKIHPEISINYTQENLFEYRERLQSRLSEGKGPDIFRIHQSWVPMLGNYLSPLPSSIYDNGTFEQAFYPSAKESLKYQGRYIAVPLMVDGLSLFYNEDIFKAGGKTLPTMWDELRKTAIELTVRDSEGRIRTAGIAMGTTSNIDHWSDILGLLMLQNGADLGNPGLCTKSSMASTTEDLCPGADALSFYTIFSRSDRVWDSTMPSSTFSFATGILAMYFGPSWRTFDIKNLNPSLNFKAIPVPQLPGRNISWSTYWVEAVSKNSPHSSQAWEFLKFLSSPEILQRLYRDEMATTSNRTFGEPYPRVEMSSFLKDQPVVGAFIQQAPSAKNWFLSSATKDNGINDQMIGYYKEAVDAVNEGRDASSVLKTISPGITETMRRYTQEINSNP